MNYNFRFSAALVHKFEDCVGIEILKNLYDISEEVKIIFLITFL